MSLRNRFRKWNLDRRVRNGSLALTPKGKCYYEYCQKIVSGEWEPKDRVDAYENELADVIEYVKQNNGTEMTDEALRVISAQAHVSVYQFAYEMSERNGGLSQCGK